MVRLSQWFITLCLWLYCISITKKSDISQWFIMLCLWLYCISITKKSDTSISDLSRYVSDCTVSVSLRRVIRLSRYVSDCTIYMIVIILWSYYFICLSSMMLQSFCSYNCLCAITFVLVGWFFWIFFFYLSQNIGCDWFWGFLPQLFQYKRPKLNVPRRVLYVFSSPDPNQ